MVDGRLDGLGFQPPPSQGFNALLSGLSVLAFIISYFLGLSSAKTKPQLTRKGELAIWGGFLQNKRPCNADASLQLILLKTA